MTGISIHFGRRTLPIHPDEFEGARLETFVLGLDETLDRMDLTDDPALKFGHIF